MKRLMQFLCAMIFIISLLGSANATTISAEALGYNPVESGVVSNAAMGQTITNGDFTIKRSGANTTLGNGIDEQTLWDFDFTGHANYGQFLSESSISGLTAATLTMTLTPYSGLITTDSVNVDGLASITAQIQSLPLNAEQTLIFDLLDYYNSADLYDSLVTSPEGIIAMIYQDDAILTYASLDLTNDAAPVPEPATMLLFGTGLAGIAGIRRKKK